MIKPYSMMALASLLAVGAVQALPPMQQESIPFSVTLSSSQEVGPMNANTPPSAGGQGSFTYNKSTRELSFHIQYADLSGIPTMAHFHLGAQGQNGPVLQTICGEPEPTLLGACPAHVAASVWKVSKKDEVALLAGNVFVNFHTALNPKGEIRGQLTP